MQAHADDPTLSLDDAAALLRLRLEVALLFADFVGVVYNELNAGCTPRIAGFTTGRRCRGMSCAGQGCASGWRS
jgi:hypothetical protein